MPSPTILDPLDAASLREIGLLTTRGAPPGFQRINKHYLDIFGDEKYKDTTLSSSGVEVEKAFKVIPVELISEATLVHVGFMAETAADIWARWENYSFAMRFEDFFLPARHPENEPRTMEEAEWRSAMASWGIGDNLQDAVLDPAFSCIRGTEACSFWVRDSMESRYAYLEEVGRESSRRATGDPVPYVLKFRRG